MTSDITRLVDTIGNAMLQLRDVFQDPSALTFAGVHADMERLEAFYNSKALVDAAFAHICERDDAGRQVGANYATTYLEQRLGLSRGEAWNRLARGRDLFAPPEPAPEPDARDNSPAPEDLFGGAGDAGGSAGAGAGADHPAEQRRKEQEENRKRAAEVSAEKQDIIRRELDKLLKAARGERARIYGLAMSEALGRNAQDLRIYVRQQVDAANRKHAKDNPNASMEKRSATVGKRKADGTVDIHVCAPAGQGALISALLDKGLAPNSNLPKDRQGEQDPRTRGQRRFDQLMAMVNQYEEAQQAANNGAASVVVAMTLDDLADGDAAMLWDTNSGIEVDCFDLVRLGMHGTTDFVLQVDGVTGVPIALGRTERCASIEQRIAMFAVQGVCSWAGCTAPMTECEAHHILAWIRGGNTDLDNLTGLCREHHKCNNDRRDGSFNKGYMDYDPGTGRAGLRRPGAATAVYNHSVPASRSAVNRLRKTFGRCQCDDPHQPDPSLAFPPPPPDDAFAG
ncbi:HNH endonuclease signature motif containing protein [Corynebacterium bouchesdurhonense]|uniref:HNH endonuclease signature motif containing protein n=1 Tax=Corynebacterium bouchesdurhonense TaxID=1720192 RepID=UPI0008348EE7|nr:HNH endonuclease signature motif containing protein [Corynebacterium bouchesdurhonense]